MSNDIKAMKLDEDGNVVDEREIKGVTPEEAEGETVSASYESFADMYVSAEEQAEETREPGDTD
ncbi:MAG: hypothetical protein ABEN55_15525 [Bradymonadaceae bacterium]